MTTCTEKAIAEIFHTVERLRERYGLDITPEDYRRACEDISRGRGVWLYRSGSWYEHWLVRIKGRAVPVVFNHKTGNITTALPPAAIRNDNYLPTVSRLVSRLAFRQVRAHP